MSLENRFKFKEFSRMIPEDQNLLLEHFTPAVGDIYLAIYDEPVLLKNNEYLKSARNGGYIPLLTMEVLIEEIEKLTEGTINIIERDGEFINVVVVKEGMLGHKTLKGPKFTTDMYAGLFFIFMELLREKGE